MVPSKRKKKGRGEIKRMAPSQSREEEGGRKSAHDKGKNPISGTTPSPKSVGSSAPLKERGRLSQSRKGVPYQRVGGEKSGAKQVRA